MITYCLTEVDIADIFVFWVEDMLCGKLPYLGGIPAEDMVEGLTKYFIDHVHTDNIIKSYTDN